MANSAAVVAHTKAYASQYNNLRSDVLDPATGHDHSGAADHGPTINALTILGVHNVMDYGAAGDGATDDTTAIQAAITAAGATGGVVYFPAATYRVDGQLTFVNNGGSPPKQRYIRLTGAGAFFSGQANTPYGGSILDMRYSGAGVAKIDTRGDGLLEIDHLTLMDGGADTKPFLQTTNTTLHIRHCMVYGTGTSQDALILGGESATVDGTDDAPFQGFGTVIAQNYFGNLRCCVYGRNFANGVVVRDNTVWSSCGGTAAIEFKGFTATSQGGMISGNLIEVYGYVYAIKLTNHASCQIIGNSIYDPGGGFVADVRFDTDAYYNFYIGSGVISEASNHANSSLTCYGNDSQESHLTTRFVLEPGKMIPGGGLGAGWPASASTPGTVVKKMEVFDFYGTSVGYVPIYDAIT